MRSRGWVRTSSILELVHFIMRQCNFNYGEFAIFEMSSALYLGQSK
nr:MAG TPA: hypothetical protein [Caudoviricetes sp.]